MMAPRTTNVRTGFTRWIDKNHPRAIRTRPRRPGARAPARGVTTRARSLDTPIDHGVSHAIRRLRQEVHDREGVHEAVRARARVDDDRIARARSIAYPVRDRVMATAMAGAPARVVAASSRSSGIPRERNFTRRSRDAARRETRRRRRRRRRHRSIHVHDRASRSISRLTNVVAFARLVHSATKTTVARASMNDFAEKVSKASVALGVAGAVLAQVRRTNRILERDTSARYGWGVRARGRDDARGSARRTSSGRSSDAENCPRRGRRRAARAPTASTSRVRAFAPS